MVVLEVFLALLVLGALLYWMRGFARPMQRSVQRARSIATWMKRTKSLFETQQSKFEGRVVDVAPRTRASVVCATCGDPLSENQLGALRMRNLQCPGSKRVAKPCPYWGERSVH